MAFVNIFSNETFFAVLWPALRTVVLVQKFQFPPLSMSSPLLNSNIVLCFCFLKENVDSFSVSVSLSLMYLCIYCIYSKNTQNGSKNLKIYCPVKISQLYYEKNLVVHFQKSWNTGNGSNIWWRMPYSAGPKLIIFQWNLISASGR